VSLREKPLESSKRTSHRFALNKFQGVTQRRKYVDITIRFCSRHESVELFEIGSEVVSFIAAGGGHGVESRGAVLHS
jgi:hypothetical protein